MADPWFDKRFDCPRCGGGWFKQSLWESLAWLVFVTLAWEVCTLIMTGCSEEVVFADWRWFAAFWALSCVAIFAFRHDDMRALRSAYWMHGRCPECGRWIGGK